MRLKKSQIFTEMPFMNGCEALANIYNLAKERFPQEAKEIVVTTVSLAISDLLEQDLPITTENLEKKFEEAANLHSETANKKSA